MKKNIFLWHKGIFAFISLCLMLVVSISILCIYASLQLPDVNTLKTVQLEVPLRIYSKEGLLIQEYGEKRRIPLQYAQIPAVLVHALLATEDQRFFDHKGVDIFGLARATVRMVQTGTKSQGGSTITMQVARNFFLTRKKTFLRKFNEIMLAMKIDRTLSKEEILQLYLNSIYLGNRAYGVGAAALVYYGKPVNELNIAQCAMIAGLPQAPSIHNPIQNPKAAKKRRNHVLKRLLEEKYITEQEYKTSIIEPVISVYHTTKSLVHAPYVAEMIRQSLYDHFGNQAYTRGYKVYTTIDGTLQNTANKLVAENLLNYDHRHGYRGPIAHLDSEQQKSAEHILNTYPILAELQPALVVAVTEHTAEVKTRLGNLVTLSWSGLSWARPALKKGFVGYGPKSAHDILRVGDVVYISENNDQWMLTQLPTAEAALIALKPTNGAIVALVGGFDFAKSKFNRATQSSRQPGSSFKPFIYAAALNKGYTLATLVNDAPLVVDDPSQANMWRPHNNNLKFNGPTRLKEALVKSQNLVSIRILDDIGIDYTIDFVSHFGFRKDSLPRTLSLALGSLSVSPLELTAAYAIFANGGYKIDPYLINKITDDHDNVLLQAKELTVCNPPCQPTPDSAPRVISEDTAYLITSALKGVIQHGTAQNAKVLNRNDIAGKTGTTNDQVDAWFAGYQGDLVVTTWVGFDNPASLHEYAAKLALPLWIDFMKVALQDKPEKTLTKPENVVAVEINPKTGLRAKPNQTQAISEYFNENNIPAFDDSPFATPTLQEKSAQENLF